MNNVERLLNDPKFRPELTTEQRKEHAKKLLTESVKTGVATDVATGKKYTSEGFIIVKENVPLRLNASIVPIKEVANGQY